MNPDDLTRITERVAITNFVTAHDADLLRQHQVRAILCLDRSLQGGTSAELGVARIETIHLIDGENDPGTFRQAVKALEELVLEHGRVVVHCRAGRSRSVAVVAAYLVKTTAIDAEQALAAIAIRRGTAVAPPLVELVRRCEP
jgi:atypical dual specificity phosphatase